MRGLMGGPFTRLDSSLTQYQSIVGEDVVPLWTVDELLEMYDLQYVDVLKIDTEGRAEG